MFPNFANFQKITGSAYCRSKTTKQISMDRFLGQEIQDAKEREQFLRDNADAIEELGYTKPIPTAQLDVLKDQLVQNNIQLRDIRADKKEAMKEFSNQIKELEEVGDKVTEKLKNRSEYVSEQCYKFIEDNEVGMLVFQRPARPDEKQPRLFTKSDFQGSNPFLRTGTDD